MNFALLRNTLPSAVLLLGLIAGTGPVSAKPLPYTGTNLSGGEFGDVAPGKPRVYGTNFVYPSPAEFDYFAGRGMNVFRLPFRWETLQPTAKGPLDRAETDRLKGVVTAGTKKRLVVILDPHNYARYYGKTVGGPDVGADVLADFWGRLAAEFKGDPHVWFGLMNEPHDMPAAQWAAAAGAAVTAIRKAGAKNLILIPGDGWSGAHSWVQSGNDALLAIKDPANHNAFEAHQYLDADSSGTHPTVVSATVGRERLRQFTAWCRAHHKRAFLGEFGAAAAPEAQAAVSDMISAMEQDRDVWLGFTWWSAGPWWGDYMFSIEPKNGQDAPQMTALRPHLQSVGARLPASHP